MALKNFSPLTPTQRFKQSPGFDEITKRQAGEISARAAGNDPADVTIMGAYFAPHWRWPQAEVSDHRFQTKASRCGSHGGGD